MKQLSTEKTMTAKEVSEVLGVTAEAIKKHVRKYYPDLIQNGKPTYLNEQQVIFIKRKMIPTTQVVAAKSDHEMMGQIAESLMWLKTKIVNLEKDNETLQIELDKEKAWYSVKRVKSLGLLPDMNARSIWSPLKKWCIENDYQIKTIFDSNYGNVKTYHADVWKAVYDLDLYFNKEGK